MDSTTSYLGIGLYTYTDASHILRISTGKLHKWADGYPYQYKGELRRQQPLFGRAHPELAVQNLLTFLDLIQLYLINEFRKEKISLQVIRATADRVSRLFQTNHPFAVMQFHTDGKRIIGEIQETSIDGVSRHYLEDLAKAQLVMETVRPFLIDHLDYTPEGITRQYWPLGREKGVVIDPARCFGNPMLSDFSIPTYPIYSMYLAGDTPSTIADAYCIDIDHITRAIEYEQALAA